MSLPTVSHQIRCSFLVATWNGSSQNVSSSKHSCQAETIQNHTERLHVHALIIPAWACSVHQHSPETSKWLKKPQEDLRPQNSKTYEHVDWPSAPSPITAEWQVLHSWHSTHTTQEHINMCAVSPMGFGIVCYEAIYKNVIILLSYAISTIITAAMVK